jgi:CMP-N-acetylneuraminic acid synthetase
MEEKSLKHKKEAESLFDRYQKLESMYKQLTEDYNRDKHQSAVAYQFLANPESALEMVEKKLDSWDMSQLRDLENKLHHLLVKTGDAKVLVLSIH